MQSGEIEPSTSCMKQVLEITCSLFDSLCFSLVNTYSSNCVQTHTGVPQGSLLSPFTFLVYTTDLTMEEETPDSNHAKNDQQNQDPRESKYADNVEF